MKSLKMFLPVLLMISGCTILAISVITGDAAISIFIIFPVFSGRTLLFVLSVILLIAGFISLPLLFFGMDEVAFHIPMSAINQQKERTGERNAPAGTELRSVVKATGVIFIGPVPIVIGSDSKTALYVALIAFALVTVLLLLMLF